MPFEFKKLLDHGASNPIVARLSLQILELQKNTTIAKDVGNQVGELYLDSLQRKLLRCFEIEERFKADLKAAVEKWTPPAKNTPFEVPQIARLEEEVHNFLYEGKNFVRDLLKVFNLLYGTMFEEASEFSKGKKRGGKSLIEFAEATFGADDARTKMLKEFAGPVEMLIAMRNAVEHPDGYSGKLVIENFTVDPDGKLAEPSWHREKDGKRVHDPSSIRSDMSVFIHNLLTLAEDIYVSWANENLSAPKLMQIALIPEDQRCPEAPVKYIVTLSNELAAKLKSKQQA